jgi:cutinase
MHGAIATLDQATKSKLIGGVLFGDSMNGKHNGQIPNFPADRVKQLCNDGDGICSKQISGITAPHLMYGSDGSAGRAVTFLIGLVNGAGGK